MQFNEGLIEQLKEYDAFPELGRNWKPDMGEGLCPSKEGCWNEDYKKFNIITKIVFYCKENIFWDEMDKEYNLSGRVAIFIRAGSHSAFMGSNSKLSTYKIFENGEWVPNSLRKFIKQENERIFNNINECDDHFNFDREGNEAFYNR